MSLLIRAFVLVAAGTVAGLVGTAGGITTLVSYPALLAVGVLPLPANIANIVALPACWPGSAAASKPELSGKAPWLLRWAPVAAIGGAAGAALLLLTPPGIFTRVVPFLVLMGSLALLFQPRISTWRREHEMEHSRVLLPAGLLLLSIYNGYFGAGSGVMILALLLLTADQHMPRANALKNMLIGATSIVSAAAFTIFGPVDWSAALPLAAGMLAGSTMGPLVARRMPARLLRWLIVLLGTGLAIWLWLHQSS